MNRRYEKVLSLLEAVVLLTGMLEWSLNWNFFKCYNGKIKRCVNLSIIVFLIACFIYYVYCNGVDSMARILKRG